MRGINTANIIIIRKVIQALKYMTEEYLSSSIADSDGHKIQTEMFEVVTCITSSSVVANLRLYDVRQV
jgi:hypothetical protein